MRIPKPNFLIIGAPKCGTTSLASILDQHPGCCMSRPKEVSFFQDKIGNKSNLNYGKGWDWYAKAFTHYNGEKVIGEATPSYANRVQSPKTAKRIFDFNPNMKIIYMVRNPLDRQISEWKMEYFWFLSKTYPNMEDTYWASKGFGYWMEKQFETENWSISKYNYQIEVYKKYFKDILITFLEDWKIDQSREVTKIFDFLELEDNTELVKSNVNNSSEERNVESAFKKRIKSISFLNAVAAAIPTKFKKRIKSTLGVDGVTYPSHKMDVAIKRKFVDFVKDDAQLLLKAHGKPENYWEYRF